MKFIDKALRRWRVGVALRAMPNLVESVFDIGCDDGYLLRKIKGEDLRLDGCDPRLSIKFVSSNSRLLQGFFPSVLDESKGWGKYDTIFALSVFEHFTEGDLKKTSQKISELLTDKGRLIVTVPHPFVDKILDSLMLLKLIDGQAVEEHHGFDPESLVSMLSSHLQLKFRKKFQLGLNNLFVFEKH
ncbi:MAG: class I SAM-dependent methyltransferase [Candidatus Pacebacteria bacterium]|nr:class I SAM-dependent methyltransferase [Candidatus Paceibacterota bacterium]